VEAVASAPGKLILFGEHAVVYGEPAISVAIARRLTLRLAEEDSGAAVGGRMHRDKYTDAAFRSRGREPRHIEVVSDIPVGCGLGSSAALCVALHAAIPGPANAALERNEVAEKAFRSELEAQGSASPIDTSTSTLGGGLRLARSKGTEFRWSISREETVWHVHSVSVGELPIVIGNTGRPAPTGEMVAAVRKKWDAEEFVRRAVKRIGEISEEAVVALGKRDLRTLGELMNENQGLLRRIGVDHPSTAKLLQAVRLHSLGAKITGAGGGGSIIALTEKPQDAIAALAEAGAKEAFLASPDPEGVRVKRSG
jgi:mevalonate kinase